MSRTDAQNGLYASLTFHKLTTMASPILCTCHQNSSPGEIWGIRLLYILIRENSRDIGEGGGGGNDRKQMPPSFPTYAPCFSGVGRTRVSNDKYKTY